MSLNDITGELKKIGIYLKSVDRDNIKSLLEDYGHDSFKSELTEWEFGYLSKLKIMKRKSDFLSGRLAGKEAASELLNEERRDGINYDRKNFQNIEIKRLDSGVPELSIDKKDCDILISISHSGSLAVSVAGSKKIFRGIGIDLEMIEMRDSSFLNIAFTGREISEIRNPIINNRVAEEEKITRYWTIKEAALKSIGSGLNINLKDIEINESDTGDISVILKNEALKIFKMIGGKGPVIKIFRTGNYIITVSWIY